MTTLSFQETGLRSIIYGSVAILKVGQPRACKKRRRLLYKNRNVENLFVSQTLKY